MAAEQPDAAARQQQGTEDVAWPLLLQHDSLRTQLQVVCKLLCCSKSLAAMVPNHSSGQLDIPRFHTIAEAEQAAPWLRKHARLLGWLDLRCTDACVAALVAALVAAGPQTLALQSLKLAATDTTLPLLEQLPASHLTRLELRMEEFLLQPQQRPAYEARVSAALGRLTALRSLALFRDVVDDAAPPLSSLSALTRLTALSVRAPLPDLQHVPPQLLALQLYSPAREQPLDLRHLAAATALSILCSLVKQGDALPPNLLRLQIDECRSVQPLLPLVQLQELQLGLGGQPDITAGQLQQLSRLTALSLSYRDATVEPASASAWPALPVLRRLELSAVTPSVSLCQQLAQLSGLTSLTLNLLPRACSVQPLAAALRQLSGLQRLELEREPEQEMAWTTIILDQLLDPASTRQQQDAAAAGMQQLVEAVGGLHLRKLGCWGLPELVTARASIPGSWTALTELSVRFRPHRRRRGGRCFAAAVAAAPGLQQGLSSYRCVTASDRVPSATAHRAVTSGCGCD